MTSVIKTNYTDYGILGQMQYIGTTEVTTSADTNNLTDLRKLYRWGYADTPQNAPFGAGYLMNINTSWGLLQIGGDYANLNLKLRYRYGNGNAWTAWKTISLT